MSIKKPILKNGRVCTKPQNKTISKFKKIFAVVSLGIAILFTSAGIHRLNTFNPGIINYQKTQEISNILQLDDAYYDSGYQMRFIAPKDGPITFNIKIDGLTDNEKTAIQNSVDELSRICSSINSNYYFKVNFNPTNNDMNKLYTINVEEADLKGNNESVMGNCRTLLALPTTSGKGSYKALICLDSSNFEKNASNEVDSVALNNYMAKIFKHEIGHAILGLDDAYKIDKYSVSTIMNGVQHQSITWSLNDLKIFIAKLSPSKIPSITAEELQKQTDFYLQAQDNIKYFKQSEYVQQAFYRAGKYELDDMIFDSFDSATSIQKYCYDSFKNTIFAGSKTSYRFVEVNDKRKVIYTFSDNDLNAGFEKYDSHIMCNIDNVLVDEKGGYTFKINNVLYTLYIHDNGEQKSIVNFEGGDIIDQKSYDYALTHCGMLYSPDYEKDMCTLINNLLKEYNIKNYDKITTDKLNKIVLLNSNTILQDENTINQNGNLIHFKNLDGILWFENNSILIQDSPTSIKKIIFEFDEINYKLNIQSTISMDCDLMSNDYIK